MKTSLTVFAALFSVALSTDRPLIGIYPTLGPLFSYYTRYQEWLAQAGADSKILNLIQGPITAEILFQQVNGFLIPGGGDPFFYAVDRMVSRARKGNENGDHFPVWGTCLGFEWLAETYGGRGILEDGFKSDALAANLTFTQDAVGSSMFGGLNSTMIHWLETEDLTYNAHHKGLEPSTWNSYEALIDNTKILAVSQDEVGRPFVAAFEDKNMPIMGVQFHPEEIEFVDDPKKPIPHGPKAAAFSRHLGQVFIEHAKKNRHGKDVVV